MKNASNFFKKFLLLFIVLVVGFIGGSLGNLATAFVNNKMANISPSSSKTTVSTSYKNTTDTTKAVKKVQNAVVSVITYTGSNQEGVINNESTSDPQVASEGSGVIYKKEGKYAYLVTNTHVLNGAKNPDILLADGSRFLVK